MILTLVGLSVVILLVVTPVRILTGCTRRIPNYEKSRSAFAYKTCE